MVGAAVTAVALLTQPLVYHSAGGWRARITPLKREVVTTWLELVQDDPRSECYGGGKTFEVIDAYPHGVWLSCDVRPEGRRVEIWRETHAVLYLTEGQRLESVQIIASPDPCGRQVLDNTVRPFVVTERIHGYDDSARLYLRFAEPVEYDEIEEWALE
jgi:hypothetical protein